MFIFVAFLPLALDNFWPCPSVSYSNKITDAKIILIILLIWSLCGVSGTGVTAYALHPGVVQTELWRHLNKPQQAAMWLAKPFTKTSAQGAQTSIFCAVAPELETESGKYYRSADFHLSPSKTVGCTWFTVGLTISQLHRLYLLKVHHKYTQFQ